MVNLEWMYGDGDLAESRVFAGGWCNFGYWETIPASISDQQRALSSQALYRQVLDLLPPDGCERLIEIGAGRGHGARLALTEYAAGHVTAIDQAPQQIARVREAQGDLIARGQLEALVGNATSLPVPDAAFDALYSVEALQHFEDKAAFVREAARVLKPGGKLLLTTFFLTDPAHLQAVGELIPTVARGVTRISPIDQLQRDLVDSDFDQIEVRAIGAQVFPGFDRWLEIIGRDAREENAWGRNWARCFERGLIDYFLVSAEKPDTANA